MSIFLCLLAFALCYACGRRSLVSGVVATLGIGYLYGITRANVPETFSHFIFDAGVLGLYAAQLFRRLSPDQEFAVEPLRPWLEILIVWPLVLFVFPIQDLLIQIVGLRGNIFLLPFIFLGARLDGNERYRLALWIAGLNLIAFAFAGAEYFTGLERFFPHNLVTEIIYKSKDVVGHTAYRIPASFANAHAYGGTMVVGLPLLIGALVQKNKTAFQTQLLALGVTAALLGLLMSAARTHFVIAGAVVVVATFSLRSRFAYLLGLLILVGSIGWLVSGEQRLQRFMELRDTDTITDRVATSVNMNFLEIAGQYPWGNGLGGGGTSIPYFLLDRIQNPVGLENEYARIMLEQGIPGLLIWLTFILWLLTRRGDTDRSPWHLGRRLAWVACAALLVAALTGIGLLTSIPQSVLFLLLCGWVGTPRPKAEATPAASPYLASKSQTPVEQYGYSLQTPQP